MIYNKMLHLCFPGPSLIILDLGCGTGRLAIALAKLLPDSVVHGYDEVGEIIEKADQLAMEKNVTNVKFCVQQVENLPKDLTGVFDLVTCPIRIKPWRRWNVSWSRMVFLLLLMLLLVQTTPTTKLIRGSFSLVVCLYVYHVACRVVRVLD